TRFGGAENVIDIGLLFRLEIEIESIEPFFQIVQIEITELQHPVGHPYKHGWFSWSKRGLAYEIALRFQHAGDFTDGLILILEQLQGAATGDGVETLGLERQ